MRGNDSPLLTRLNHLFFLSKDELSTGSHRAHEKGPSCPWKGRSAETSVKTSGYLFTPHSNPSLLATIDSADPPDWPAKS